MIDTLLTEALHPPCLTDEIPGTGGRIKVELEDFEVEEIPAYEPCGEGDHLYLWVQKRDVGAEYFGRELSRRLDIPVGEVGVAGNKDRRAVTRQWVSVPATVEPRLAAIDGDGIEILKVSRHTNKLRQGHLSGNRFSILIRDAAEPDPAIVERLSRDGLPNFYGEQRFGNDGETAKLGFALFDNPRRKTRNGFLKKLALSAVQSVLFNVYLGRRMRDGLFRTVLAGDVMSKWPRGGLFVAEDVEAEQARFDERETVHAGPMFGRKTFAAAGDAAERESAILSEVGFDARSFGAFGKLLEGTRRMNLIYPEGLAMTPEAEGLRLTFSLPAGSYATVLLREVMKTE